ncbi:TPA: hypothetical protein EYO12_01880 [Candidatus Saccharibacteria bacterium]|jgi:plastocyanin|nr:hypothetical protein [Candidatus Saccharibacteria bacterium]HIO87467.1 hypothetical protein [Candidatus Saccharibacteria bacterium]
MNKLFFGLSLVIAGSAIIFFTINNSDRRQQDASTEQSSALNELSQATQTYLSEAGNNGEVDAVGQPSVAVSIGEFYFEPTLLTISKGTTVTWTNTGDVRHNIVSWSNSLTQGLNSDLLANSESFSYTFEESGEYVYFCEPHPFTMRGVVRVIE